MVKNSAEKLKTRRYTAEQQLYAVAGRAQSSLAEVLSRSARLPLADAITGEIFSLSASIPVTTMLRHPTGGGPVRTRVLLRKPVKSQKTPALVRMFLLFLVFISCLSI